jgi:acetyl/propionyl-CoA carboxylase alpha subunit
MSFKQSDVSQRGHATECRVYAEDPENNFLPSAGKIIYLEEPSGANLRIDTGVFSGCEVPVYYDPILSKVITYGYNREESIARMLLALKTYRVVGIKTNIPFLIDCLSHPEYQAGNLFTGFIPTYLPEWAEKQDDSEFDLALAGAVLAQMQRAESSGEETSERRQPSPWDVIGRWEL